MIPADLENRSDEPGRRCSLADLRAAEAQLLELAPLLGDDGANDMTGPQALRVAAWIGREIDRRERAGRG